PRRLGKNARLEPERPRRRQQRLERRRLHQSRKIFELARRRVFAAENEMKNHPMKFPAKNWSAGLRARREGLPSFSTRRARRPALLAFLVLVAISARAQYPRISPEIASEAKERQAAADRRSDEAFERALPLIKEWDKK